MRALKKHMSVLENSNRIYNNDKSCVWGKEGGGVGGVGE